MADQVELSVKSQLNKILEELAKINNKAQETSKVMTKMGKTVGDSTNDQVKKTEKQVAKTTSIMRRMLDTLKSDFKSLAAINAIQESLKLSNVMKGSITEALNLGDAIRRLGPSLGIAQKDFSKFQSAFIKGMGDIGLSSEQAQKALEGLAETPVRGEKNLLAYAKTAGMLGQIGGEKGQEGNIAKGMSGVIQARGGDVNNAQEMKALAEDIRRVTVATGKGPMETINAMNEMFTSMSSDFRKSLSTRALANLAAGAHAGGPNATKFIEEYLKMGKTQRAGLEARGVGGLVGEKGLNTDNIKKFYDEAKKLGQGDIRLGLKAMGVDSDDAAEGFQRLAEHLEEVKDAQNKVAAASGDLASQFEESKGMLDQFKGSLNKVKSLFSGAVGATSQGGTEFMGGAGKSKMGAVGTVLGAGVVSAMLAGGGLRGIGKGLFGEAKTEAKKKAIEALTGKEVQDVNVINAEEIGEAAGGGSEGGGGGGKLAKVGKAAGAIAGLGAAFAVGTAVGGGVNEVMDKNTQGTTQEGFEGNAMERLMFKMDKMMGGEASGKVMKAQKMVIELNERQLKKSVQPSRGASQ